MAYRLTASRLLLTGATGHLGAALLPRLASERPVLALVRARDDAHLAARRATLLEKAGLPDDGRVDVVRGDVTAPGLGLSARDRDRVLGEVGALVHGAASVRFDQTRDEAARHNVDSTREVLTLATALAEAGRLERLDHISTAYVAGDRRGRVTEAERDEGQGFRNAYEWSKCQSEGLVEAAVAAGLPVAVHRPSIVAGDSTTGQTDSFNVLYAPLRLYVRGWWRTFPGRLDATVDVVPVDFVADALCALRRDPGTLGRRFHLAQGDAAPTIGALMDAVRALTGGPPLRVVDQAAYRRYVRPLLWPFFSLTARGRSIQRSGSAFLPYFEHNPLFDTTEAAAALGPLRPPAVEAWLARIVRYAIDADFGAR